MVGNQAKPERQGSNMTEQNGSGTVEEYQGEKLSPALPYTYKWNKYDTITEAKNSEDWPNDNDILKFVNQSTERAAKAKAYQETVKDKKKEYEQSEAYTTKEMEKLLVIRFKAQGLDEAAAVAKAKEVASSM